MDAAAHMRTPIGGVLGCAEHAARRAITCTIAHPVRNLESGKCGLVDDKKTQGNPTDPPLPLRFVGS